MCFLVVVVVVVVGGPELKLGLEELMMFLGFLLELVLVVLGFGFGLWIVDCLCLCRCYWEGLWGLQEYCHDKRLNSKGLRRIGLLAIDVISLVGFYLYIMLTSYLVKACLELG